MGIKTILTDENDSSKNKKDKILINTKKTPKLIKNHMQCQQWRTQSNMQVIGNNSQDELYFPITSFKELDIDVNYKDYLKSLVNPTAIQSQSWPILMNNRDCISIAETGSGKTLSYLIPALQKILPHTNFPQVVILSPTRELATQIYEISLQISQKSHIKPVCIIGGTSKFEQIEMVQTGAQIVIGTPGRIKDLIEMGKLNLKQVGFLVLDEADKLLEQGFQKQIEFIFTQIKKEKQIVLFSATWPIDVQEFAKKYYQNALIIKIGTDVGSANKSVQQLIKVVQITEKQDQLISIIKENYNKENKKIMIFVMQKAEIEELEKLIKFKGYSCVSIHGDKGQKQRDLAYNSFKNGECLILVATDLAARGLDIKGVDLVINYTLPKNISSYIHRIGRTGRAGSKGLAISLYSKEDRKIANQLCDLIVESGQQIPKELEFERYKALKKKKKKEKKEQNKLVEKKVFQGKKIKLI